MAEITETEAVAGATRRITFGGQRLRLPASPTLRYMFWMRAFLQRLNANELTEDDPFDCYDETVTFLRRYNPKLDEEKLKDEVEIAGLISFYAQVTSGVDDDDATGGDERPPRPSRSGSATRTGRSRSTPRSRS